MKLLLLSGIIIFVTIPTDGANDFSSFLSVNASIAVVLDEEYVQAANLDILLQVKAIIENTAREHLKNGGLNVKYFTWNSVRLKKDLIAALTVANCDKTWNLYRAASESSVLLIAITDIDCPRLPIGHALMVPIIERGEEIPQLLLDFKVQNVLNWKSCVAIFDSSMDVKATRIITSLVHASPNMFEPIAMYLYTIDENLGTRKLEDAIAEYLNRFAAKTATQFMVFSSAIQNILEVAKKLGMLNVYNQWLLFLPKDSTTKTVDLLASQLVEGSNVAFAINSTAEGCDETILCSISEVVFGFVNGLSKVIEEENSLYGQISDEEWEAIRPTKKERQNEILSYITEHLMENRKCTGCSQWTFKSILSWGIQSKDFSQNENSFNFKYVDVGYWNPVFGFTAVEPLFPHISQKFRKISLDVLTFHNPPWQIIKYDQKRNIVGSTGIILEILRELANKLNFTYNLIDIGWRDDEPIQDDYDEKIQSQFTSTTNNISPKLEYMLQGRNIFIAAVAATIDGVQVKPYNFTNPISVQKYTFLSRKPDEVSRIYLFTAPFATTTWIALAGAVLVTAPILYAINILVPLEQLRTKGLCTMKNCYWYIYGALLQQGGMYLPKADSGRVIIGIWWIVVIVVVTTYCGNLVAFLTFPKYQPGISYLHETFQHPDISQFGLRNGTFFEKFVPISTRSDFKRFMDRVTIYNTSNDKDIRAIREGKRINIDWKINLQLIMQEQFEKTKECNFVLGAEDFVEEQIGMILPRGNPYTDIINDELKRLHQMGFIEQCHKMFLPSTDKCNGKGPLRQITNHKVNLADMQGCFLILLFGVSLALFVMVAEFWSHHLYLFNRKKFPLFAS